MLTKANPFKILGTDSLIFCPVSSGATVSVLVDTADLIDLIAFGFWRIGNFGGMPYACATSAKVLMHRLLMGFPETHGGTVVVDHINRRSTDNRRSNLRVVSQSVNTLNSVRTKSASPHGRNVSFCKTRKARPFRASIHVQLGYYATADEAQAAVRAYRKSQGVLAG